MMELIQGEGGVLPLDREFVKEEKLCREKRYMLLIIDEVQTGIGRTGSLFAAFQQYDIRSRIRLSLWQRVLVACRYAVMAAIPATSGTHATTAAVRRCLLRSKRRLSILSVTAVSDEIREGRVPAQRHPVPWLAEYQAVRGMGLMLGIIVGEGKHSVLQ